MSQQLWATQYANWNFAQPIQVWNLDQTIWIPQPNNASFWAVTWRWIGQDFGGYLGLQQGSEQEQQVRFSLWNATAARAGPGATAAPFGGEGIGWTITLPLVIDPNKFYRLSLWRVDFEGDHDGQWWGAWLIDVENGVLVEHAIGLIRMPMTTGVVDSASIQNFVEYWGQATNQCSLVPLSIAGFTPPAVNSHGKGTGVYSAYATYAGSARLPGNICFNGNERQGALVTARPYDFGFAQGVLAFLGGASQNPPFNTPTPPDMPNS